MRFVSLRAVRLQGTLALGLAAFALACSGGASSDEPQDVGSVGTNYGSFEEFEKTIFREPESNLYIVNGDEIVENSKQLEEFYELVDSGGSLIVNRVGSSDDKWSADVRKNLTYCVSDTFGSRKAAVVQAMNQAGAEWAATSDIKFVHVTSQDANCTASNNNVVFDVRPINVNGQYLARAFFPSSSRSSRNVIIDNSAFNSQPGGPTLVGIIRHELGHTLGFRHEHTRPEAARCFENNAWRALTTYDQASTMHYPQCNGISSWALAITQKDSEGAAALYGPPGGGGGGGTTGGTTGGGSTGGTTGGTTGGGTTGGGGGGPATDTVSGSVARLEVDQLPAYSVAPGSVFTVTMTGTGDPDLYVRFGAAPTTSRYNCRPYLNGASETCRLDVPAGTSQAFVAVRGYTAGTYTLRVSYTKP